MRKIYLFLIALLLISPVMAADWDNRLTYEDDDMTGVITNALGLGKEIGRVTLKSHDSPTQIRNVIRGKDRVVMYYDFKFDEIYQDGLGEVSFIDERTGKEIEKDYHFVKEVYTYSTYNTYEDVCSDVYNDVNKTWDNVCVKNITGTEEVKRGSWEKIGNDIPKGDVRIGLATDVDSRDYIDGIWKIAGVSINKHSSWTESLNAGLVAYYNFNDSADNVAGRNNLTNWEGTPTYSSSNCLIGDCGQVSINNNFGLEQTTYMNTSMSYTMNFWARYTSASQVYATYLGIDNNLAIIGHDVSQIWYHRDVWTGTAVVQGAPTLFDQWYMITIVRDQSNNNLTIYQNGTQINKMGFAGGSGTSGNTNGQFDTWTLGSHWQYSDREMVGQYDEMGFWNRTLSGAEIQQLFNNNSGITYTANFNDDPAITFIAPNSANYSAPQTLEFSANASDTDQVNNITLTINGTINSTQVGSSTTLTFNKTLSLGFGVWTYYFNVTDSGNVNIGTQIQTINISNQAPAISFIAPLSANYSSSQSLEFSANASDNAQVNNITLTINGTLNSTQAGGATTLTFNKTITLGDGTWTYYFNATDNYNFKAGTQIQTITIDSQAPSLDITFPTSNTLGLITLGQVIDLNYTVSDPNLQSCYYTYNGTNNTLTCGTNATLSITDSNYTVEVWANDSFGNRATDNVTFVYDAIEISTVFNATALETSTESFILNISYNNSAWSAVSAKLNYNGTNYTGTQIGTGDSLEFVKSLDMTSPAGEKQLHWIISLTNSSGVTDYITTKYNQTVNTIGFGLCNSTQTPYLNFTVYNGTSPFPIINATFKSSWDIQASGANGTTQANFSFEDLSEGNHSFTFCFDDESQDYSVTTEIEIDGAYSAKNFHYLNDYNVTNTSSTIPLYLLDDSLATLTVLKVEDDAQRGVANVYISIQYYDVGTDTFYNVGMAKTSTLGEDLAYLNWYDSLYKFVLVQSGATVYQTTPYKIAETPQVFQISSVLTNQYSKFRDFDYTLTFNNDTQNFVLTFTKPSGDVDSGCLRVTKRNQTGDNLICDTCATSSSATLYCNVASSGNGTYVATFYATGSLYFVDAISQLVGAANEIYEEIGLENGAIFAIIFSGISFAVMFVNPVLGIIGLLLGVVGSLILGFLPLTNYFVYAGVIVMGIMVIALLRK